MLSRIANRSLLFKNISQSIFFKTRYPFIKAIDVWATTGARLKLNGLSSKTFSTLSNDTIKALQIDVPMKDLPNLIQFADQLYAGHDNAFGLHKQKPYKEGHPPLPSQMKYWFRGHACDNWDLVPTIYRHEESEFKGYLESPLVKGFLLQHPDNNLQNFSMLKTLSKMQHHRYPTRLLDWSSNIVYAAYFACNDIRYDAHDGLIWILDPFNLNVSASLSRKAVGLTLSNYFDTRIRSYQSIVDNFEELIEYADKLMKSINKPQEFYSLQDLIIFLEKCFKDGDSNDCLAKRLQYSIAVDPGHVDARLAAQKGKFTLASGKHYFNRATSQGTLFAKPMHLIEQSKKIKTEKDVSILRCIKIEAQYKPLIRKQLRDILGIDESSMMLDLDFHGNVAANIYSYHR